MDGFWLTLSGIRLVDRVMFAADAFALAGRKHGAAAVCFSRLCGMRAADAGGGCQQERQGQCA